MTLVALEVVKYSLKSHMDNNCQITFCGQAISLEEFALVQKLVQDIANSISELNKIYPAEIIKESVTYESLRQKYFNLL